MISWVKGNRVGLTLLILLPLLTYAPFLGNVFLSDDLPGIFHNKLVGDFSTVLSYKFGLLRPLLYFLAYHLGGLNPVAFRLINLLFHLGSVILILAIVEKIHGKKLAFLAALLFAVHPILAEPVVWISGGAYTQATFFLLAAFLTYLCSTKSKLNYLLSLIFFFLGLTSQATPLIFPGVLFLYELTFGKFTSITSGLTQSWKKLTPFFLLSALAPVIGTAGIAFSLIPERTQTLQQVHYQQVGINNPLIGVPIAITHYLQLIFWPSGLTLYHSELFFNSGEFLLRCLLTLIYFSLIIYLFIRRDPRFFWLSLFLIGLIPTIISATLGLSWIVAERYVYFSTVGIIVATLLTAKRYIESERFSKYLYPIFFLIILLLFIRTVARNNDWRNEDNLWIATGKTSPSSPNTHNNLGDVYGRQGDKQAALGEFQRAIQLKPDYADAYHNLANTYHELNQDEAALENYQRAYQINPRLWQSLQNMAVIYFQRSEYEKALELMRQAELIDPQNPSLKAGLGIIYLKQGDKDRAKQFFAQALGIDPNNQAAQVGLAESSQ